VKKQMLAAAAVSLLVAGCAPANAALHGYHRYVDPSPSMEPAIRQGQTFDARPVRHGKYRPKRGDVVVFTMPSWSDGRREPFVKRVVAIAGDKIACCTDGKVVLNSVPLSEPYLAPSSGSQAGFGPVTVPPGRLWVMGDNRDQSADSRLSGHDTVPATAVIGIAVLK
jgi:signal peptidase I